MQGIGGREQSARARDGASEAANSKLAGLAKGAGRSVVAVTGGRGNHLRGEEKGRGLADVAIPRPRGASREYPEPSSSE